MRILFISKELIGGNVAYLLKKEGHEVKLYIESKLCKKSFDNMLIKIDSWRDQLEWVGKDGLIVFDDVGYGKVQDKLRKQGYTVFGGSEDGERLELDREYGQKIFKEHGLNIVPVRDFDDMDQAAIFVKNNRAAWAIKQNNQKAKYLNYVGVLPDGEDVLVVLRNFIHNKKIGNEKITLQEKIDGVEIGVGRYFNGTDWVGPIEFNVEHTSFFPGDLGPLTSEMGTLAWYSNDEKNRLFQATLAKLKPYLKKTNFRGDFEINCVVNRHGIFPLEATARLGTPIVHLHTELHKSPWGEFLYAVASGKKYELKWRKGYGIVMLIATPPFPYAPKIQESSFFGMNIYFNGISKEGMRHVHFEDVAVRHDNPNQFFIAGNQGYILYLTSIDKTIAGALKKVNMLAKKVVIPKMLYRNDLGIKFDQVDRSRLRRWGYL